MKICAACAVVALSATTFAQSPKPAPKAERQPRKEEAAAAVPATPPLVTDAAGVLSTRAVWPIGVPLYVRVNTFALADGKPHTITMRSDIAQAPAMELFAYPVRVVCILSGPDQTWDDLNTFAGTPLAATDAVRFTYTLADPQGNDPAAGPKPAQPLTLPVQIKGSITDLLTPTPLPDLEKAIPKQLNAALYLGGEFSKKPARLWIGTYTNCEGDSGTKYPGICNILVKHPDVTFAVKIDVIHDGVIVATTSAWWRGESKYKTVTPFEGMLALTPVVEAFRSLDRTDGKWRLHLTPAPEVALRDFESTRYWKGEATAPVRADE